MNTHMTTAADAKRRALSELALKDVMTPQPITIGREQTLAVAHDMMREHGVRHLPVLDGGVLVGILSQRDVYFLETIAGVDLTSDRVDDGMCTDTYAVAPHDTIEHVAEVMSERKLGSAVVVERGRVVGIFTATDALRLLAKGRPAGRSTKKRVHR